MGADLTIRAVAVEYISAYIELHVLRSTRRGHRSWLRSSDLSRRPNNYIIFLFIKQHIHLLQSSCIALLRASAAALDDAASA